MEQQPRFSVITVTYNNGAFLRQMLDALFSQPKELFEAILIDNCSTDDSLRIAREFEAQGLQIIANTQNLGFGGANNQAAKLARGEVLFLLNPDAILPEGGLLQIAEELQKQPMPGVFGLRLVSMDGSLLMHDGTSVGDQAHCLVPNRAIPEVEVPKQARAVEVVSGATMLVHQAVWQQLGGFDLAFHPAYYEDSDLCLRAQKQGIPVVTLPVNVRHHENVSAEVESWGFLRMHHRHRWLLIAKHFSIARILFKTLPKELAWLMSWRSKRVRKITLNAILAAFPTFLRSRFK
ncbi:MAG: glycosyltransferase family 2 protein [Sumerlaeia bacterium]